MFMVCVQSKMQCVRADVNEAAITRLQLNGTDVAMTTDNAFVLQQITYEMLGDVTSAPVSITRPLVRSQAASCSAAWCGPLPSSQLMCYTVSAGPALMFMASPGGHRALRYHKSTEPHEPPACWRVAMRVSHCELCRAGGLWRRRLGRTPDAAASQGHQRHGGRGGGDADRRGARRGAGDAAQHHQLRHLPLPPQLCRCAQRPARAAHMMCSLTNVSQVPPAWHHMPLRSHASDTRLQSIGVV